MSEEWYILGGLICILLVFIMFRKCKKSRTSEDTTGNVEPVNRPSAPPPLPPRRTANLPPRQPSIKALDYPKCPVDRSRNEPGKPQVVFWDNNCNCYICCHGHHFTGRE